MKQGECLLLPTENLSLFRIDSERIKKDHSHWKQGHNDSLLLLTKQQENKLGKKFLKRSEWQILVKRIWKRWLGSMVKKKWLD